LKKYQINKIKIFKSGIANIMWIKKREDKIWLSYFAKIEPGKILLIAECKWIATN